MLEVAKYVKIFDPNPTDDLVTKRISAVAAIKEKIAGLKTLEEIFEFENDLAEGLAVGRLPKPLIDLVESEIKAVSPAFVLADNELQAVVCALLATEQIFGDKEPDDDYWNTIASMHACANWLAMSAIESRKEAKIGALRDAVQGAARDFVNEVANHARVRYHIGVDQIAWPATNDGNAFAKEVKTIVQHFEANAALDREEIDLLWWALNERSSMLHQRFSSLPAEQTAIIAALELSRILDCLPVEAHKHLILRHIGEDKDLPLTTVLEAITPLRGKIYYPEKQIDRAKRFPRIFPLTLAIVGEANRGLPEATAMRLSDWSARVLLESAILKVIDDPKPGQ